VDADEATIGKFHEGLKNRNDLMAMEINLKTALDLAMALSVRFGGPLEGYLHTLCIVELYEGFLREKGLTDKEIDAFRGVVRSYVAGGINGEVLPEDSVEDVLTKINDALPKRAS
jgi:hypothetical protein